MCACTYVCMYVHMRVCELEGWVGSADWAGLVGMKLVP